MIEVVVEEIGVQEWSEMRERSVSRQMEYLLGLNAEWKSNSSVRECETIFRQIMRQVARGRGPLVIGDQI